MTLGGEVVVDRDWFWIEPLRKSIISLNGFLISLWSHLLGSSLGFSIALCKIDDKAGYALGCGYIVFSVHKSSIHFSNE